MTVLNVICPEKLLFICFVLTDMDIHQFSISKCANHCQVGQSSRCTLFPGRPGSAHCGQRCPASQEREQQNSTVFLGKCYSLLCIQKMKLCTWEEKDAKKTKQNEMEAKCWQNSNCIGFMLIGFLK
jgi:hypothetical protein